MIRPPPRSTRTYTLFPNTTLFRSLQCERIKTRSKTKTQTSHDPSFLLRVPRRACIIRRFPEFAGPLHANVGNKLACDFVLQAQARRAVCQAAAYAPAFIVLAIEVHFYARLKVKLLSQQDIVFRLQCQGGATAGADIRGHIHFRSEEHTSELQPLMR